MNKRFFHSAWFYASLAGGFFMLDLLLDQFITGSRTLILANLVYAVLVIITAYALMNRAVQTRQRAEAVLRQANEEMEKRVIERTADLERSASDLEQANASLQKEICERQIAEQERERSLAEARAARQRAESLANELQVANNMLHTLIETLPIGMVITDAEGQIVIANSEAKVIMGNGLGRNANWLESAPVLYHLDGRPIPPEELPLNRAIQHVETTIGFEAMLSRAGQPSEVLLMAASPVRDENGRVVGAVKVMQDITDRRKAEEALRASEDKFATVFRFSPYVIAVVKIADRTFLDVNEAFTRTFGYPRSAILGKTWTDLNLVARLEQVAEVARQFVEKGKVVDYELMFTTAEGATVVMLISLIAITVQGEPCVLLMAHDITEMRQAEEALLQVQTELARGMQERAALEERQRLARELHDSVSQALYGIALGAHTALTLINTDQAKVLDAINFVLSLAQAGLTEMRALIFELRPESLQVEGLVSALAKQTAAIQARYGIEVNLELCDEPGIPLNTKEALYRITQEALQNAIKHARPSRLDVRLICEADRLRLEVCDNGIGFNPQAAFPGHLGLHSMRERAKGAGGSLQIISESGGTTPGCGTQILVSLPLPGRQNS